MLLNINPTNIVNIVIRMVNLGNTVGRCKHVKKTKKHKVIDDRDDDPSNICSSIVSEDPISDEDPDHFIRNFSDMSGLN